VMTPSATSATPPSSSSTSASVRPWVPPIRAAPASSAAAGAVPPASPGAELGSGPEVTEVLELGRDEAGEPEVVDILEEVGVTGKAEVEADDVVMGSTPGAPAPATTPEPGAGAGAVPAG